MPPTVNGMLGGYPQISQIDLRGSSAFITKIRRLLSSSSSSTKKAMSRSSNGSESDSALLGRGVDCGAGIGRVTGGVLAKVCRVVDVVEPIEKFARETKGLARVGDVYVTGMEEWDPGCSGSNSDGDDNDDIEADDADNADENGPQQQEPGKVYDLVWLQWCVGYLNDEQFVQLLRRCRRCLSPSGFIVVKENVSTDPSGNDIFDPEDSSVIRTDANFRSLYVEAGLTLIKSEEQLGFPKSLGLFPVRFYALRPATR